MSTAQLEKPPVEPRTLRTLADLPSPKGLPVIGNLLQLDIPRMHQQLEAWAEEFGPMFRLRMARGNLVIVGDHELTANALRHRPEGFSRTARLQEIAREMGLLPGVFGAEGESWKAQRRMVMAGFDPAHVRRYHPALARVAGRLEARWARAAQSGAGIDLQSDLMRYTVDAIAGLAFGSDVNTLESDGDIIQQHLDRIFPALFKRVMSPFPTWRWFRTREVKALEASIAEVNRAVQSFIDQARARLAADPELRNSPNNLLEAMIVAADEPGSGINDTLVAGNVMTMLLAGEDTTANTLAWMIDLLWRHPQALARATQEVRSVLAPGESPSMDQLAQLEYIEACAHETMRLKPVAPILGLQAIGEAVVGDVRIPSGTVIINLMRRDSVKDEFVPNGASFDPTRWLAQGSAAQAASSVKRISMPFGAGPRICPGRYLALVEIKMAMATLLNRFDLASVGSPGGGEAAERMEFTMMPVGLEMRLRERA